MTYVVLKALHVIGLVCWFAGLFYLVRLFIYHVEALGQAEPRRAILHEQFALMERRLWAAITVPAMILTAATGGALLSYHAVAATPWLHLKFSLLLFLFAYHFICGWARKKLAAGGVPMSSKGLRIFNEVPTVLLVAIVFTAVGKTVAIGLWALVGCAAFLGLLVALFLRQLQGKN